MTKAGEIRLYQRRATLSEPFSLRDGRTVSDTCELCGSALTAGPGKGRPRKYCADACRQAAHRRRLLKDASTDALGLPPSQPEPSTEPRPSRRVSPAPRTAANGPCAGDELLIEIAKDIQDSARDLARLLPSSDGEEPLRRVAQLHEQLDGLTAAVVGRARHRRLTWAAVSSLLGVSEDTARHRYTERYILRRLARFNRSEAALTSLNRIFSSTSTRTTELPDETASESDAAGGASEAGSDRNDQTKHQTTPIESSGAAYNRLAPILSMLIRTAQLTNKEVSKKIGCSPSFLSRILTGERVPTWDLTGKFAQACGADPTVLRTIWESEKLSHKNREPDAELEDDDRSAAERLRVAVQTLHLRAGRPAPHDIAVASRWLLSAGAAASVLEATVLPHPSILETFVRVLGGDIDHFNKLLNNARAEAEETTWLQPSARPSATTALARPTSPPPTTDPHTTQPAGADAVMRTFSKILTEDHTVEDGRARLLDKRAEQQTTPQRRAAGTRPRPLTPIPTPAPAGSLHRGSS
ncbi:helix-turn-helix transcriptional regulator [Streptomyces sp. NPDC006334]|uniref:helix-turn-helix domain-containing protein n=1 Tax=Streptomyces sp. NPDC006334 TaxID=3156754 RepID=UPI0033B05F76